jgi:SAM-dependent methyltransferase
MTYPFEPGGFDFIAAVAVLHHLPLRPALERFRDLLAPGGVLAVIGLYRRQSIMDWAADIVALPVSRALRITRECSEVDAPLRDPQESLGEIRAACNAVLPGAKVERRLLFRYSLYWRKPDEA